MGEPNRRQDEQDCSLQRRAHEALLEWSPRPLPTSRALRRRHRYASAPALLQPLIAGAPRGSPEALPGASKPGVRIPLQRRTQGAKAARHIATAATTTIRRFWDRREASSVSRANVRTRSAVRSFWLHGRNVHGTVITREVRRQDLDGDRAIEPHVARLVDVAHAARANQRHDFIIRDGAIAGDFSRLLLINAERFS